MSLLFGLDSLRCSSGLFADLSGEVLEDFSDSLSVNLCPEIVHTDIQNVFLCKFFSEICRKNMKSSKKMIKRGMRARHIKWLSLY